MSAPADGPLDAEDAARIARALAPLLGIPLDPAYLPGIVTHLQATARLAALVADFPLDDEAEPAPVYRP